MQRVSAVLGSALFFLVAPCVLAGLIPWSMTRWEFRPAFSVLRARAQSASSSSWSVCRDSWTPLHDLRFKDSAHLRPLRQPRTWWSLVSTGMCAIRSTSPSSQLSLVRLCCLAMGASFCLAHCSGSPSTCSSLPMKSRLCGTRLVQSTRHIARTSAAGFRGWPPWRAPESGSRQPAKQ